MIIGIPKEIMHDEARVAATPEEGLVSVRRQGGNGDMGNMTIGAFGKIIADEVSEQISKW